VTLTDRDRKILFALVPIVVLVAYWFLLLAPKRESATTAGTELSTQQQRLDDAKAKAKAAQGAKQSFDASYAQVVRLGKAIPSTVDMPSLLVQLDAAAAGTGIRFTKIKTGERVEGAAAPVAAATTPPAAGSTSGTTGTPVAAGGATAQSAPGGAVESANNAQQTANQSSAASEQSGVSSTDTQTSTSTGGGLPVGGGSATPTGDTTGAAPAGLSTVPLELEFEGNFFNLADFFHRVKRFVSLTNDNVLVSGRLVTVENVKWSSDAEIFPHLRAEIKATVYLSPKAQGVTAGATPQGPSTTTPTTPTTPADSTPAATPTATATR
jgi:Tfp pilus assembly protein PilO